MGLETTVELAQESSLPKVIEASSHDASADIATEGSLYQALECGPDGQPGGILMTSVGQQVLPNVWLGNYRALEDQDFLRKNKISHILTLGHFKNQYPPSMYIHKIIPVADNPEANIIQFFPVTNEFIEEAIEGHHRLLVHCLAGVSRSPTVLAAYLMHKHRLRPKEALAIIRQARPFVNPNPGFMEQLRLYREMGFEYNPQHPEFIEFHKRHPLNADHAGHEEYAAKRTIRN